MSLSPAREAVVTGACVLVAYLLLRATDLFLVGAFNDDGVYVALGKAIADGAGYHLTYLVGEPVAVKYPPGLPAVLALPWALTGTLAGVRTFVQIVHPLAAAAAAGLVWWLGRQHLGLSRPVLAVCAIGPFVLEPAVQYYNIALSEPYMVLGWAASLTLAARLSEAASPRIALVLGATLAATALFRSAALALIPAVLLALVLQRCRRRDVALCAGAALAPLLLWRLVHGAIMARGPLASLPDETPYWQWLPASAAARVVATNAMAYVRTLSGYVLGGTIPAVVIVVGIVAIMVWGAVRAARARPALVLTVAAALAAVLVWPWAQGRLLLPILPFAGLLAAGPLESWLVGGSLIRCRAIYALLAGFVLLAGARQWTLRREAERALATGGPIARQDISPRYVLARNSRYIFHLAQWVRANTTLQNRIVADYPAALFLYTGRRAVPGSPAEPAAGGGPSVFAVPGRYLASRVLQDSVTVVALGILGSGLQRDLETIAARCPGVLQPVGDPQPGRPAMFYRVQRQEVCLREL